MQIVVKLHYRLPAELPGLNQRMTLTLGDSKMKCAKVRWITFGIIWVKICTARAKEHSFFFCLGFFAEPPPGTATCKCPHPSTRRTFVYSWPLNTIHKLSKWSCSDCLYTWVHFIPGNLPQVIHQSHWTNTDDTRGQPRRTGACQSILSLPMR